MEILKMYSNNIFQNPYNQKLNQNYISKILLRWSNPGELSTILLVIVILIMEM